MTGLTDVDRAPGGDLTDAKAGAVDARAPDPDRRWEWVAQGGGDAVRAREWEAAGPRREVGGVEGERRDFAGSAEASGWGGAGCSGFRPRLANARCMQICSRTATQ
ncbi:MAG: hypothetical protein JWM10_4831 [Myxococcaceae bacterium]|nr:hypothetical protein [Myxococcaceae bacterium]